MEGREREDSEDEPMSKKGKNVSTILANADQLKNSWVNFMDEFYKLSFDLDELDPVLSHLKSWKVDKKNIQKMKDEVEDVEQASQDMDSLEDEVAQLEKKVFGNHLLSKSIFGYLSIRELLPCRLVNTNWNKTVSEMLVARHLTLRFSRTTSSPFRLSRCNWKTLDMFTELFGTSTSFPCTRFVFDGNINTDCARRFFSQFRGSYSYLNLNVRSNVALKQLVEILVNKAVNIEELVLTLGHDLKVGKETKGKALKLDQLTWLTLNCDWKTNTNGEILRYLSKGAKNLKVIKIKADNSTQMFSKLKSYCRKSILKIENFQNVPLDDSVNLPVFENVQHIDFKVVMDSTRSFFPEGSSFSVNFPKLKSLSIELSRKTEASSFWQTYFPIVQKVPTVETIMINSAQACPPDTEKLLQMFPKLKNLVLFNVTSFLSFAETIRKFHKALPILKLGKDYTCPKKFFPFLKADSNIDIDGLLKSGNLKTSYLSNLEFIWENFVENNNNLDIAELREDWTKKIEVFGPLKIRKSSTTTYRLHDSSTLTLTEILQSRGMKWKDALAKHSELKEKDGGFFIMETEIKGTGAESSKVVRTVETVQLLAKKKGSNGVYFVYKPNYEESIVSPRGNYQRFGKKVSPKEAKPVWKNQYTLTGAPTSQCQHIFIYGRCNYGLQCVDGIRELPHRVLSGSVLKVLKTVDGVLSSFAREPLVNTAKQARILDDVDPIMGILIPNEKLINLKQALTAVAESEEEHAH